MKRSQRWWLGIAVGWAALTGCGRRPTESAPPPAVSTVAPTLASLDQVLLRAGGAIEVLETVPVAPVSAEAPDLTNLFGTRPVATARQRVRLGEETGQITYAEFADAEAAVAAARQASRVSADPARAVGQMERFVVVIDTPRGSQSPLTAAVKAALSRP